MSEEEQYAIIGRTVVEYCERKRKLAALPEVSEVKVEIVFDPPWIPGMMSEAAKLQLGFDSDYGAKPAAPGAFKILR